MGAIEIVWRQTCVGYESEPGLDLKIKVAVQLMLSNDVKVIRNS